MSVSSLLLGSVNIRWWRLAGVDGGSDRSLTLRLGAITTDVLFCDCQLENGAILLIMRKRGKPMAPVTSKMPRYSGLGNGHDLYFVTEIETFAPALQEEV